MEKKLYRLSFRNIKELNNVSLNFNDVRNVLNSDVIREKTGRIVINFTPDMTYEINDRLKQKEVNEFLSEQVMKIQKRKKAIFETFIKGKDSFLERGKDNRQPDYIVSALDFYNFFGKENITIHANDKDIEESYNETAKKAADSLYGIYEKRNEAYKNRDEKEERNKKKASIRAKIENQKREISQSYVFMTLFNYIKKNFEYEKPYFGKDETGTVEIRYRKEAFQAEIPLMNSLNLNFSENKINEKDFEQIKEKIFKARLGFDREKKSILIPESLFTNDDNVYRVKGNIFDGELVTEELSKKEIFRKLILKKFVEMMKESIIEREEEGEKIKYYAVNVDFYNIDINRVSFMKVVKSVVFREIINELRPYIVGEYNKDGKITKKSIKLNDTGKIQGISEYKKEQIELLFKNRERNHFRKIEEKYREIEKKYVKRTINEQIKEKIKEDIRQNIKREKEKYFETVREIKERTEKNIVESEKKNKDLSFNFKIKNLRKKAEREFKIDDRIVGIFLDDIYNALNKYIKKGEKSDIDSETAKEKYNGNRSVLVDRNFLFLKILTELWERFDFVIPVLGKYGEKISDKFVTIAFFNNMNNVNLFLENIVYNAYDIDIIKDKYKIFRKSEIKKEMIFLNLQGKVESKQVTYWEYLEYKYKKKYKINRENPFEIKPEDIYSNMEVYINPFKYHRITGENVKYLFININSKKELRVDSGLFKNYRKYMNSMIILDGVINKGNEILEKEKEEKGKEIILKNFIFESGEFDIYVNEEYIETTHYNLDVNSETAGVERIEERLRNILSRK